MNDPALAGSMRIAVLRPLCNALMNEKYAPNTTNADGMLKTVAGIVAYLLFWILFTASGLWLMLEMRGLIVDGMIVAQLNPWAVRGYDRVVIFVLGLGWFIALIWFEHYLRTGNQQGRLWRNILNIAVVQAILAVLVVGIRFFLER